MRFVLTASHDNGSVRFIKPLPYMICTLLCGKRVRETTFVEQMLKTRSQRPLIVPHVLCFVLFPFVTFRIHSEHRELLDLHLLSTLCKDSRN